MQIQHSKVLQKAHPTAAKINESVTAGPAYPAAAIPVNENNSAQCSNPSATNEREDKVLLILFRF
jgi:hypothetical protein